MGNQYLVNKFNDYYVHLSKWKLRAPYHINKDEDIVWSSRKLLE